MYIYAQSPEVKAKIAEQIVTRRKTDSGLDLFIPVPEMKIHGKTTAKIGLGIVVAAKNYLDVPAPLLLLPRSSISKTPLRLANSIGLIDAGYRGEVSAMVDNIYESTYEVFFGDRLFQLCSHDFLPFTKVVLVDRLEDLPAAPDDRGDGGFGSTGR